MIEGLAKALYKAGAGANGWMPTSDEWPNLSEGTRRHYRVLARAAVLALREPLEDCAGAVDSWGNGTPGYMRQAAQTIRALIAEAEAVSP